MLSNSLSWFTSLKSMFTCPRFLDTLSCLQRLLREGVYDLSLSGVSVEECRKLKRIVLLNCADSKRSECDEKIEVKVWLSKAVVLDFWSTKLLKKFSLTNLVVLKRITSFVVGCICKGQRKWESEQANYTWFFQFHIPEKR